MASLFVPEERAPHEDRRCSRRQCQKRRAVTKRGHLTNISRFKATRASATRECLRRLHPEKLHVTSDVAVDHWRITGEYHLSLLEHKWYILSRTSFLYITPCFRASHVSPAIKCRTRRLRLQRHRRNTYECCRRIARTREFTRVRACNRYLKNMY